MDDLFLYTLAHPRYFETLERAPLAAGYAELLRSLLPANWAVSSFDVWLYARPNRDETVNQGFKLHVSACLSDVLEIITSTIPFLVEAETSFKMLADPWLHRLSNSKRFPRASAGKFITIYPANQGLFTVLAEKLYKSTQHFHGPYILSDRRYKDSTVIYYRYGGFKRISEIRLDGTHRLQIRNSKGDRVSDERRPFFELPEGIRDPFPESNPTENDDELLNKRYRVEAPLNFTNTGGVYRAIDLQTASPVVIKEARPYTVIAVGSITLDAIEAQRRERESLQLLQGLGCVPRLVETFVEWEHHFLVESYVEGVTLARLRAQADFVFLGQIEDAEFVRSCSEWKDIGLHLLAALDSVHSRGLLIGDISPINVLWNRSTKELTFIDLESACRLDCTDEGVDFNTRWAFPGFRPQDLQLSERVSKLNDYYACGMLLYNLICPIQVLFHLDKTFPRDLFLEYFVNAGLPIEMARVIYKLLDGDATGALLTLCSFSPTEELRTTHEQPLRLAVVGKEMDVDASVDELENSISATLNTLAQTILASTDLSRKDRLWPADALIFSTNPLSLAYGACGTAIFLNDVLGSLPSEIAGWILRQEVTAANYPPGLYVGMSGIAWAYSELGWSDRAKEIMRLVPRSALAFDSPALLDGAAGWGLAALALFATTQDEEFMTIARLAADHLVAVRRAAPQGCYWTSKEEDSVKLGMGFGGSGIALFLLNLWRETQSICYLNAAKEALEFEITHGTERRGDDALLWSYSVGAPIYSPYWIRGGGGIASALVRFYELLGDDRYLRIARRAAIPCAGFFSVAPHLFEGLASMGETLLDMYQVTGERDYYGAATLKARQVLLYQIKEQDGIAFPGRTLIRISHDYATGGAGIGLFLNRFLTRSFRKFHDLRRAKRLVVAGNGID